MPRATIEGESACCVTQKCVLDLVLEDFKLKLWGNAGSAELMPLVTLLSAGQ